ncbi:hypothetical protein PGTUg99_012194 [Puccinia graminis f. sp. tritici]|uniref:Secreted protein n=1 Tax=Puccinia graminis f. sp. tritici TaxID=56615 RepID=A0A5B0QL83_PUCGR|nr:hypothetical protein PGTUg99_012194 [Puccinia graminis f. sp. tritici]
MCWPSTLLDGILSLYAAVVVWSATCSVGKPTQTSYVNSGVCARTEARRLIFCQPCEPICNLPSETKIRATAV